MLTALNGIAREMPTPKTIKSATKGAVDNSTGRDDSFTPGSGAAVLPGLRALVLAAGVGAMRTAPQDPIEQRVTAVMAETLEASADQLAPEASLFDDLGGDSIDWFEFITGLEAEFKVKFSEEDAARIRSIADAVSHLKSKGGLP